jgi:haloalkane dehalogenase
MPVTPVLDTTIHHEEGGDPAGTPVIFLHGNPTSSHAWRNVAPHMGPGVRTLAPDLVGMGRSGRPASPYRFVDHAHALDAWVTALDLARAPGLVLVGHDWGGALALDHAARHPGRVRAVALMETILRPFTWADFPGSARSRYEALRGPAGETKVLDENFFIEVALPATVRSGLADEVLATYADPYPTRDSRRWLLVWPREMPIEGEPADVTARVAAYGEWMAASTDVPKLLLTFDGTSETLMIGPEIAAWARHHVTALETVPCGPAGHVVQEDQPAAIAAEIGAWLDRHSLRAPLATAAG